MDLFECVCRYLEAGKKGTLATVVRKTGCSPRDLGAKEFFGEDGANFGTVGDGHLESDLCRRAVEVMKSGRASLLSSRSFNITSQDVDASCGDEVAVLLEPVTSTHLPVYRKIDVLKKECRRGVIVTQFGKNLFKKSLLGEGMSVTGDLISSRILDWCRNVICEKRLVLIGGVLAEPLRESFPLYVFGSGPIAQSVSTAAKMADFDITMIEDRGNLANQELFPDAKAITVHSLPDAFGSLRFTGNEYVVVVTGSHECEAEVLEQSLRRSAKFVGMIGSKKKMRAILGLLRERGMDRHLIGRIHAPIGLPIHAETPQEVGISVAAELISLRNGSTFYSGEETSGGGMRSS